MNQTRNEKWLPAVVTVLAVIALAGAVLLLCRRENAPPAAEHSAAETVTTAESAETSAAASKSTAHTTFATTVTTTVTTVTTAVTEPPAPSPEEPYRAYVRDVLIPQFGLAKAGESASTAQQTGIAGVLIQDFLGTGTPDMLVIRLDVMDVTGAAVPVFFWYTMRNGSVVQADVFECKLQWSGYCIRYADKTLYISGEWLDPAAGSEIWRFTEMAVQMQDDRDLVLQNMEQGPAATRPAPMYPENAELLTEMQLDAAVETVIPSERRYLLWDYTDAEKIFSPPLTTA